VRATKEFLVSESNQRSLGGKEVGRAINESWRQSVGRALMKYWLEAPATQSRKPIERTLAIVLLWTSNECCVPYHLRGLQLRPEGLLTKVADAHGAAVVAVPGRRAVDLTWVL